MMSCRRASPGRLVLGLLLAAVVACSDSVSAGGAIAPPAAPRDTAPVTPAPLADSARCAAAAAYSDSMAGDGLLVMRNGAVVFERYAAPTTAARFHMLASGTKSFACALYALGAARGYGTLDTRASDIITEWQNDERKRDIRLKRLLSLCSGLLEAPTCSARMVRDLDTYALGIWETAAVYPTDSTAIYTPTTFRVIAAMLERRNGTVDPVAFLEREVLAPLGIASDETHPLSERWTRDAKGKPQMAGGAYLTAREWGRYGQLILQGGSWNSVQLLSAAQVAECLTYRSPAFLGHRAQLVAQPAQ